ncbi:MAG: hypothetical protein GEV28_22945 [Actinophytocola sp.]|uniref:PEP/pyruvate-binding domain-containing protein n=1 Tax=Actinophytocola sp. TaxID=1872138 RepID=UPI00132798C5|nr:PEP/pyruvate-binding domain-containing protein [Actinophytocola sp.]MPZ83091.1 hypothetical protein [Actinophytocola sp.]
MSAAYTSRLDESRCLDRREFGGKAAGLAGLAAAGMPVAPGFAVGAAAYRAFLDEVGGRGSAPDTARLMAEAPVPERVVTAIREGYQRLCAETGATLVPVAVRSSATAEDSAAASFAGGFDTWVDVVGAEDVVAAVRRCWAGVCTARATGYATAIGVDPTGIEMAVVVQRMICARSAGVMFTISPVTGDRSRIVVEASWGVGLAVVGGDVTPDRWVVDKVGLTVVEHTPGDKRVEYRHGAAAVAVDPARSAQPCLTDDEVIALARLGKQLDRRRGGPQDIEFAMDGGNPVLLQCRQETVWSTRPRRPRFPPGQSPTGWISGAVTPKSSW